MVDEKKLDTVWLGSLVHERIQDGMNIDDAVLDVHGWISKNGKLQRVWGDAGSRILHRAFHDFTRSLTGDSGSRPQAVRRSIGRRRTYRDEIMKNPDLLWLMPVCIGGSKEYKALGEWSRQDTLKHSEFYHGMRDTMEFRGELWSRVSKVQGDLTLREASESGKLNKDLKLFVLFHGQIDSEAMGILSQDVDTKQDEDAV